MLSQQVAADAITSLRGGVVATGWLGRTAKAALFAGVSFAATLGASMGGYYAAAAWFAHMPG